MHQDSIDRDHNEDDFSVENGQLALVPGSNVITADDDDSALALALHALDAITWRRLTLTPGLRFELIRTTGKDNLKAIQQQRLAPGADPRAPAPTSPSPTSWACWAACTGASPRPPPTPPRPPTPS